MKLRQNKKKQDEFLDTMTLDSFKDRLPLVQGVVGRLLEPGYFDKAPEPEGLEKLVELTKQEKSIIIASSHGTMIDPGVVGILAYKKHGMLTRYCGGSNWYIPGIKGLMRDFGSIKTPRLGGKHGKSDMEAYLNSLVSRLTNGSIDGHSVPIWIAVPAGRSRDGLITVNPTVVKTFLIAAETLQKMGKELYMVTNDILVGSSPDQFAMEKAAKIREMKSGLIKGVRYLFNELRHYMPAMFSKQKMNVHVSYSEPINLTTWLVEKYGMKDGRLGRETKQKAVEELSQIILDNLLDGAVVFQEQLPPALMAYAVNKELKTIQPGSSGELLLSDAARVSDEWLSKIPHKNLPERLRYRMIEAYISTLFRKYPWVAKLRFEPDRVIFSKTKYAVTYRANAFAQMYQHFASKA